VRSRTAWLSRAAITGTEQPVYTRFHTDSRRCSARGRSDAECFTAPPAGARAHRLSPTPLDVTVGVDGKCEAVVSELPDEAAAPLHAARTVFGQDAECAPAAAGTILLLAGTAHAIQTLPLQAKLDPGLGANSNFSPRKAVPLPFLVRCPRAVRVVFACGGCVRSAAGAPAGQGPCLVA